jgi:DNA-binding response OmpR family regulator
LIVLDSDIPGLDGYKVCERIRQFSMVPIVMLVSSTGSSHRVKGLCAGADQCMTKPFYTPELLARIQAVLRRVEIFEQKGYHCVFQSTGTRDDSDQCLFNQD